MKLTDFPGWAGYNVARSLDPKKYQAVVVSPRSYFVFTPLLASTSVGTLEYRTALEPIRSKRSRVSFFQGWADNVDFGSKTVTIEEAVADPHQGLALTTDRHAGKSKEDRARERIDEAKKGKSFDMKYDKLIIAVGCYSQTFGTPGVREHAYFLKDVGDARRIRNRLLTCFEIAALPTTRDATRKRLLNFAVIGGGPTGIEFSAELHDIIHEDLARLYPELIPFCKITVFDVASKVLPMFDEKLGQYAIETFKREGIDIKTERHVEDLRPGPPSNSALEPNLDGYDEPDSGYTLKIKEEGEIGVGMVVWSTGLMANPFVEQVLSKVRQLPADSVMYDKSTVEDPNKTKWIVKKSPRTGSVVTNNQLRVVLEPGAQDNKSRIVMKDVYALGDCGMVEDTLYPATAQVANQKALWLAKRLNRGDIEKEHFSFRNMGVMAYIGNWNAIFQTDSSNVSGKAAWFLWRGAYLTMSVSLRNKILIPVYW